MTDYIAFDTSNYTTSVAVLKDGTLYSERRILPVKKGERGLRQSDAVFLHTKALHEITDIVMNRCGGADIAAVGYSDRPRNVDGSYMPCFLVGENAAKTLASVLGVHAYAFSHQEGHIRAGVYSCGAPEAFNGDFLFFHVSGGTTELLHVTPKGAGYCAGIVAETGDISVGQLVDRTGVLLGTGFPAGGELEAAAKSFNGEPDADLRIKPVLRGGTLNLSGFENKVKSAIEKGVPKEEIAFAVLRFSADALMAATEYAKEKYGDMPILFAGGVMRNEYIRSRLEADKSFFASIEFSSDNAAGTVLLTRDRHMNGDKL